MYRVIRGAALHKYADVYYMYRVIRGAALHKYADD